MIQKKGFTFIEAFMVIIIVGILAGAGVWFLGNVLRDSVFIPNQLNMDQLANDALNIMIEGDEQAHGLRFARAVSSAAANVITFYNQDDVVVRYSVISNQLWRSIAGGADYVIPGYVSGLAGVTLMGAGVTPTLFIYYDASGVAGATAANVRRIQINLIAKSGSGAYNDWQGSSQQETSVALKRLR